MQSEVKCMTGASWASPCPGGSSAPRHSWWFEITDTLPQHESWSGSRANVRKTNGET
jgi:hypothetical protein